MMTAPHAPDYDRLWSSVAAIGGDKRSLLGALEAAIRDGTVLRGTRLPNERSIARATGLSRNSVRDALSRLADRGMIDRQVGRGTFVTNGAGTADRMREGLFPAGHEPSPRDLVEFRAECEPTLAVPIVMNASDAELAEIEQLMLAGRDTVTWYDCEEVDSSFHTRLFLATGNSMFGEIGQALRRMRRTQSWLSLKERTFSLARWQHYQREHELIMQHLIKRDSRSAREALQRHFARVHGWVAE
jgi:GntR family transcriptional repressor for pyruvate dehydrogenase complex